MFRGTKEILAGNFHGNSKSVSRKILNVPRGTTEIMAGKFHRKFKSAIGKD